MFGNHPCPPPAATLTRCGSPSLQGSSCPSPVREGHLSYTREGAISCRLSVDRPEPPLPSFTQSQFWDLRWNSHHLSYNEPPSQLGPPVSRPLETHGPMCAPIYLTLSVIPFSSPLDALLFPVVVSVLITWASVYLQLICAPNYPPRASWTPPLKPPGTPSSGRPNPWPTATSCADTQ